MPSIGWIARICIVPGTCSILCGAFSAAHKRRLRHEERLAMISRGMNPDQLASAPADEAEDG
ncbi:MAG: hypothetical protein H0X45_01200 [Planctomycetes bacterium]|nr:hypothetical protein [Planctomycetota bacterium]